MARKITSMNINWKLPDDIVKVIFLKLPFSNLPNCRIVCKAWNDLVLDFANSSSPNAFILCAYDFSSSCWGCRRYDKMRCIDFDSTARSVAELWVDSHWNCVHVLSFCNGLLQIHKEGAKFCCDVIWNPMTNEFFELPVIERMFGNNYKFGFGFSPNTNQYKLFRIFKMGNYIAGPVSTVEVLRFGIDSELQWRAVGCQPFSIHDKGIYYLDGVVYWIGNDITNKFVIYGLDVQTETFETIHILDVGPCPGMFTQICPFNGTICVIIEMDEPIWERQVWIMRAKHFWIREFVIHAPIEELDESFCFIKAFENEGRIFFLVNNDVFCLDKTGKRIHTLSYSKLTEFATVVCIDSFHFGSLSKLLAG